MPIATIASGATTSDAVDLGAVGFSRVYVYHTTGSATVTIQASVDNSNFYNLYRNNSSVAGATFVVETIGSAYSGFWVPIAIGHRYLRAVTNSSIADGTTILFSPVYK